MENRPTLIPHRPSSDNGTSYLKKEALSYLAGVKIYTIAFAQVIFQHKAAWLFI
jgi:hypothetical protein